MSKPITFERGRIMVLIEDGRDGVLVNATPADLEAAGYVYKAGAIAAVNAAHLANNVRRVKAEALLDEIEAETNKVTSSYEAVKRIERILAKRTKE